MEDQHPRIPKQEPLKLIAWLISGIAFATISLWKNWALSQITQLARLIWP